MDKKYIIDTYASSERLKVKSLLSDNCAVEYLNNLYPDSESIKESLYRLKHNIQTIPVCPVCGNKIHWTKNGYPKHCSNKCTRNDPESIKKYKETCIDKYGVDNPAKTSEIINKIKKTCNEKYGGNSPMHSYKVKVKYNIKQISIKRNNTKLKNNTFNTSKTEIESYDLLKNIYPDVIKQYTSELYPYNCDFYIPSLNLYIECNYHWTHGGHWFNVEADKDELNIWLEKSKTSKFYANAIDVWTIRDVNKHNTAIENSLNYKVFWNINELKEWLSK